MESSLGMALDGTAVGTGHLPLVRTVALLGSHGPRLRPHPLLIVGPADNPKYNIRK